ncbi:MAG TPA: DUF2865 domain-containing protein [Xanthobacteraceae bacterium]|nr:DUF2865 domain-containing protein [Xanthobacteraceae bacterium]
MSLQTPHAPNGRRLLPALLLALAVVAPSSVQAQTYPAPPGGDRNAVCIRLEGQLAQLDRGTGGQRNSIEAAIAQQQSEVDRLAAQVRQFGCDKRGFLIFQPQLPPQCEALNRQLGQARSTLDRTMMTARGNQGGVDEQRRQLVYALAQNDCGPQYRAALGNAPAEPRRPRNFFEQLFGVPRNEEAPSADVQPMEIPQVSVSTYRTVCVRTCDGFFFPISFAATPARFSTDEELCQRQCPGTEARLFAYRNPGEDIQQAVAINGQPYNSLPNALLYRKEYVQACSCRPQGMSWAQALSGVEGDDPTLRQGDIVVTEDKAREMAQPRTATPPAAAPAPKPAARQTQTQTLGAPLVPPGPLLPPAPVR